MATSAKVRSGASSGKDYEHLKQIVFAQNQIFKTMTNNLPIKENDLIAYISSNYALRIMRVQKTITDRLNETNKEYAKLIETFEKMARNTKVK